MLNITNPAGPFVLSYRGKPLDSFSPNGLPLKRGKYSATDIFQFSKNSYMTFNTIREADTYVTHIIHEIHGNAKRYFDACPESYDKLLKIAYGLNIERPEARSL